MFYLAQGTETTGTFGLYRWQFAGPESGPDPHFHRTITESFYVLDGTVSIYDGKTWVKVHAGDFDADDRDRFMREHDNHWV